MDTTHSTAVTTSTFMTEVIEASTQQPVLVDFWAPWCAPCRQLMPILERLAAEYAGRFKLAKINTDEEPQLAHQLGVRSLPTVVLFKDGTVVDHFVGLVPESQIRALLDRHVPQPPESPLDRALTLKAAGDRAAARAALEEILAREPSNVDAQAELAELRLEDGDVEAARETLERLRGTEPNHARTKRLAALLEFRDVLVAHPDVRALEERAEREPDNLDLRHALAVHRLLAGQHEAALGAWLDMLRKHRSYKDDLARRSLVLAFELLGPNDPLVASTRREMAKALFA
ncbi:MAG: thioredoxin [Gammaproteobacteria bacterium]|nr:thioredoxin [Gammaproteobacteria bacterium]